jgi:hypothetical protein
MSSLHQYSNRFLRSTDLLRDFDDPNGLQGYCLTDFGLSCMHRISEGLKTNSSRRAWRLTGDFGSGKSSFALFLANALRDAKRRLPKELHELVIAEIPEIKKTHYVPVLIVGNRGAIAPAILRALQVVLKELFSRGTKSAVELAIEKMLQKKKFSDDEALHLIREANIKIIQSGKASGMLLILDEVGKHLEFAALHPELQDIYFLQQLAEMASRSGKQPFMFICLLHQGFNAYAEQLTQATQREWEKISGRFDEIIFQQPLDQIALLISSALNPVIEKIPLEFKKASLQSLNKAIELGWFGTTARRDNLHRFHNGLFPLDPMVLPVLVRTFQRYGQNERSLFSFLSAHEPFGLRSFSNRPLSNKSHLYQLADFYDYARANFGHRLAVASYRTHWNVIESIIEARTTDNPLELRVLKTVGILNLLNSDDFLPTEDAICWAVGCLSQNMRQAVKKQLGKLNKEHVIYFRGAARGYSLWPYTSVDIEGRLEEAKKVIPQVPQIAQAITEQIDSRPIVARAHYIKTGNLRYFDIMYCKPNDLVEKAVKHKSQADGLILIPLCETQEEHKQAKANALLFERRDDGLIQLVAVPQPLSYLQPVVLDAQRWEWVQTNTPELKDDRFAAEEVHLHLQEARNRLQKQLQSYIGLNKNSNRSTLTWFYLGDEYSKLSGREVLSWLSEICDKTFTKAPVIKNELINRNNISSAAAAARMRLLELMFSNADKEDLGLQEDRKPPEKSMYLSVLKKAGLHFAQNGKWQIALPVGKDTSNVKPTLIKIQKIISKHPDNRISIRELIDKLRRPPYGLRDGLFPIFLAVIAIIDEQEIAFYENGTFLAEMGKDAFLRMIKVPEKFDIQYCKIEGVRSALFHKLAVALELIENNNQKVELLDVVRKLCQFVAHLPDYVLNTKRISAKALAVRTVIMDAREPVRMIFHDLPVACGFHAFEVNKPVAIKEAQQFVEKLKGSLDELRGTFINLQRRIDKGIAKEFGYSDQRAGQYRSNLAARAEQLLLQIEESKLKAFAFRIFDEGLSESEWLESVGSLLALRPPSRWKDDDEDTFQRELENISSRFKRAESIVYANGGGKSKTSLRIAVTKADGSERQEVIHFDVQEENVLKNIQNQIAEIIEKNERLGVAAASRAIWTRLKSIEEDK